MSQRTERVDELLREEIGAILARDVQDPRIGFATITDVETTPDLRHARVWVSIIGPEAERAEALAALERAMGYVRHELGRRLRIKRIPELHVRLDASAERGTRILRLLSELEEGTIPGDLPEGETLPTPVARIRREGDADEPPPGPDGGSGDAPGSGEASGPGGSPHAPEPGRGTRVDAGRSPSRGGSGRGGKGRISGTGRPRGSARHRGSGRGSGAGSGRTGGTDGREGRPGEGHS